MRIWARTRQAELCVSVSILASIIVVLSGQSNIPIPQLTASAAGSLPIALFVPLLVALVVAYSLSRTTSDSEAISVRPLDSFDTILAIFAGVSFAVIIGIASFAWPEQQPLGLAATRNLAGFIGLVLIARHWLSAEVAAVPAVLWALSAAMVGAGQDQVPRWWAWPIAGSTSYSWIFVTVLALLGIVTGTMSFASPSFLHVVACRLSSERHKSN